MRSQAISGFIGQWSMVGVNRQLMAGAPNGQQTLFPCGRAAEGAPELPYACRLASILPAQPQGLRGWRLVKSLGLTNLGK